MQMCTGHWEMLKEETLSLGLGDWIATSGETAALQQADQISRQEPTRLNFDPLMDAHNMILGRTLEMIGFQALTVEFGCPICRFNEKRTPEGACACTSPNCHLTEPGSIPDFETWLTGPGSAPHAAKAYMVEQGWIS